MALGLGIAVSQKLGKGGLAEDAAKFALFAGAALFVADKGLFPAFTREQEDEAEVLARKAVGGNFKNDSLTRYAVFQTRWRQGKLDQAQRNLECAIEGLRPSLAVYRELADIHWARGRREQAMGVLESAFEAFQKPPELYADLIYRHYQLGDTRKANTMAMKCKLRNRAAGKVCGKAAKGESPRLAKGKGHLGAPGKGSQGQGSPSKGQTQKPPKGSGG